MPSRAARQPGGSSAALVSNCETSPASAIGTPPGGHLDQETIRAASQIIEVPMMRTGDPFFAGPPDRKNLQSRSRYCPPCQYGAGGGAVTRASRETEMTPRIGEETSHEARHPA